MTSAVHKIQKTYSSQAMSAAVILSFVLILLGAKAIGKGLLLGALFSVLNFTLMAYMLPLRMQNSRRKSILGSLGSIWVRLALLSLPLFVAVKYEAFDFFAAAAGLFMVQMIIVLHHIPDTIRAIRSRKRGLP